MFVRFLASENFCICFYNEKLTMVHNCADCELWGFDVFPPLRAHYISCVSTKYMKPVIGATLDL